MHGKLAIRVDAANPDHHLGRDGGTWWVRYTVRTASGASRRIRRSLGTDRLGEARRRRDELFASLSYRPPGRRRARATTAAAFAALDEPASAWNRAAGAQPQGDPFCCRTEWQFSFHEAFRPHRQLHFRADRESLIGFAEQRYSQLGLLLEPIESSWLFGTPLLGEGAVDLLEAFLGEARWRHGAPSVLLCGLLRGSDTLARLARTFRRRYDVIVCKPELQCGASLAGGLDGFLARRSGKLRRNLRRAARRARDRGVTFERQAPATAAQAETVYDRMLAVERASWKGIGRCGMAEPPSRGFYARMLRRLAAGRAGRVLFARSGERDIGFIFGGLAGAVYRGQQFSFAEDWRAASIGNLLQVEKIRWLCEEDVERYDMGPLMDYKYHWTELRTPMETRLLQPRPATP